MSKHVLINACKVCLKEILNTKDLNRVLSSTAKFNPWDEIQELPFKITNIATHICRSCRTLLEKRHAARKAIVDIDSKLFKLVHGSQEDELGDARKSKSNESKNKEKSNENLSNKNNMEIDIQVKATPNLPKPLVIEHSKTEKILIPKPFVVFNADRKKVKITDKTTDKNFHDYCETTNKSTENKNNGTASTMLTTSVLQTIPTTFQAIKLDPKTISLIENSFQPSMSKPPIIISTKNSSRQHPATVPSLSNKQVESTPSFFKKYISTSTQTASNFPSCWYHRVAKETSALISVRWPSSDRHKIVPRELLHLAINLSRGSPKDIAKAAWNHGEIQKHLMKYVEKAISKEADLMCSEKYKSILKKNSPEEIMEFTFDQMDEEMRKYCPMFYSVLKCVAHRQKKEDSKKKIAEQTTHRDWKSSLCIAASACLCQRNMRMHALEMMLNMLEDGEKEALPKCVLKLKYIFVPE